MEKKNGNGAACVVDEEVKAKRSVAKLSRENLLANRARYLWTVAPSD